MRLVAIALLLSGCAAGIVGKDPDGGPDATEDTTEGDDTEGTDAPVADDGPEGFIGGPCESAADCDYDDAECLSDGYPRGMCSQACEKFCPDADGYPTTFCVTADEAPGDGGDLGDGACFSRCDYGEFPGTGCRPGYGCAPKERANEAGTEQYVCVPGAETSISACQQELIDRGIDFEPLLIADDHPDDYPNLTCHIEDPVKLAPKLHGVDLLYYDGAAYDVTIACNAALAVSDTIQDIKADGATALYHIGTYVCRTISGTSTLSRHAYGDAIDIYGVEFDNGDYWTLIDDWEHDTTSFETDAGEWLYESAYDWHDAEIWKIILTPNYNAAHDNHFHVDMTPGSDFIKSAEGGSGGYIGPMVIPD